MQILLVYVDAIVNTRDVAHNINSLKVLFTGNFIRKI